MAHPVRVASHRPVRASERTAREMFFAMLGAASVLLMLGLAGAGYLGA